MVFRDFARESSLCCGIDHPCIPVIEKAPGMAARGDPEGYYRALGVPRTASADEIRHAFRARAMASHPDRAGETVDGETFRLVREAYEVLRDPMRRIAYDAAGLAAVGAGVEQARRGFRDDVDTVDERWSGATSGTRGADLDGDGFGRDDQVDGSGADGRNWAKDAATGASWVTGFGARYRQSGRRAKRHGRTNRTRPWLLVGSGALVFALLLALGAFWSANRQLADREAVLAEAYERLARLGEAQADLSTRYRNLAFLDIERALQRGSRLFNGPPPSGPATGTFAADWGRAAALHEITFPSGRFDLGDEQAQALARALVEMAGLIDRLPVDADWLIVIEAQAARAAWAEQVAIDIWEPALLRLEAVLNAIVAQGLPSERFAVRFNAGFAPLPQPSGAALEAAFDRVLIKLVCCGP